MICHTCQDENAAVYIEELDGAFSCGKCWAALTTKLREEDARRKAWRQEKADTATEKKKTTKKGK